MYYPKSFYHFSKLYFIFLAYLLVACSPKKTTTQPQFRSLTEAVYASGKIYPLQRQIIASKVAGYVHKIYAKVGKEVEAEELVLQIRNEVADYNVKIAQNNAQLATLNADQQAATLQALQDDVRNALTRLQFDSTNYQRLRNLYQQNATTTTQLDQAYTQYQLAKQSYAKALNMLKSTQIRLQTERQNALQSYQSQISTQKDFSIIAPQKGKIYNIFPKEGDLVLNNSPLFEIGKAQDFEAEILIDEEDIGRVKLNQKVILKADALPHVFIEGKVSEIYPAVSNNSKSVKVIVTLSNYPNNALLSGMSVEANIIVNQVDKAMVIPKIYLIKQAGKQFVRVAQEEKLREVKTGAEDLEFVQITAGLQANDSIELTK